MIDILLIALGYLIGTILYWTLFRPVVKNILTARRNGHEFKPQITTDDKGVHINWKPTPKYDAHYTRRLEIEAGMENFLEEYDMSLTTCGNRTCRTCYWKARNMLEIPNNNVILRMMNEKQNKFVASLPDDLSDAEYSHLLTKWKNELSQRAARGIAGATSPKVPKTQMLPNGTVINTLENVNEPSTDTATESGTVVSPNERRVHLPRIEDDTLLSSIEDHIKKAQTILDGMETKITDLEDLRAKNAETARRIQYHMDKKIEYNGEPIDGHLYFQHGDDVQAMELVIPDGRQGYNDPTGEIGDKALRLIVYGGDEMLKAFGGGWTGEKYNISQDFIARPVFGGELHISGFNVHYSGRPFDDYELVRFTMDKTAYACKRRRIMREVHGSEKVSTVWQGAFTTETAF